MLVENVQTRISLDNVTDVAAELSVWSLETGGFRLKVKILNPPVNELAGIYRIWHKKRPVAFTAGILQEKNIEIPYVILLNKQFEHADLILEAAT